MPLYRAELLAKKPLRYAALIHDVSQVLYLPFDYDDGSYARDRSGYNNSGTIYGATLTAGKIGMGRKFDGTDDYVEVPDSPSLRPTKITMAVYFTVEKLGAWQNLLGKGYYSYNLHQKSDNRLYFEINTVNGLTRATVEYTVSLNEKVDYAVTYDGTDYFAYVNGISRTITFTTKYTGDMSVPTKPLLIGVWGDGVPSTNWKKGVIDEVRIHNRPQSRNEVRMLMYRRLI